MIVLGVPKNDIICGKKYNSEKYLLQLETSKFFLDFLALASRVYSSARKLEEKKRRTSIFEVLFIFNLFIGKLLCSFIPALNF